MNQLGCTDYLTTVPTYFIVGLSGSWNMNASLARDDLDIGGINTPRILELDVNRMMYGHNQVSRCL